MSPTLDAVPTDHPVPEPDHPVPVPERSVDDAPRRPPRPLRVAGVVTAAQGLAGLGVAAVVALRELRGGGGSRAAAMSGYGIALWFAVVGGAVLIAGVAVFRGRRGGRAPAVVMQLLLIPVVWSVFTIAAAPVVGVALALVVATVLVTLFLPVSTAWMRDRFEEDHPRPGTGGTGRLLSAREERSRRGRTAPDR